ncbi:hypothetical protein JT25_002590 [Methylomonas denitrificans]|uniref:HTH cro/C1-type domain-containing protein n=2 Tax=Methylococcaceae TaxID=403 RepID=A0A140E4R1_9GAMM|nr:hypothetical protein [Methylomonas denitrificans]AMK75385.1 hypothetical protein JT25_002590 [Methylomonas denitrificans]
MPIKHIKAAAELYAVSVDWLIGISGDWEQNQMVDQQRDLLSSFHRSRVNHYSKIIAEQIQAENAT